MKGNKNLPKYSSITHEAIVETNKTLRFKKVLIELPHQNSSESRSFYGNSNFKPPSRLGSLYRKLQNLQNNKPFNKLYNNTSNSQTKSANYHRDDNRPRNPFSRNHLGNVQNYVIWFSVQEKQDVSTINNRNAKCFRRANAWTTN